MKFYPPKNLALIILFLFYPTYISGIPPNNPTETDNGKLSLYNFSDSNENDGRLKFNIRPSEYYINIEGDDFNSYMYDLNDEDEFLLYNLSSVRKIKFNGELIIVDSFVRIPNGGCWAMAQVFTCKHNVPVLIRLQGKFGSVFLSRNPSTKTWTNRTLVHLKEFEKDDKNGAKIYHYNKVENYAKFYEQISKECSEIVAKICNEEMCGDRKIVEEPLLEITINFSGTTEDSDDEKELQKESNDSEFSGESSDLDTDDEPEGVTKRSVRMNYCFKPKDFYANIENEDITSYTYHIQQEHRSVIQYPNRIEYIRFCGNYLGFDSSTKLIAHSNWSFITIYAHKNVNPVFIQIIGQKERYFYAPDFRTKSWKNKTLSSLKDSEEVDENGVVYYKYDSTGLTKNEINKFIGKILKYSTKLAKKLYKNEKNEPERYSEDPDFKILVKLAKPIDKLQGSKTPSSDEPRVLAEHSGDSIQSQSKDDTEDQDSSGSKDTLIRNSEDFSSSESELDGESPKRHRGKRKRGERHITSEDSIDSSAYDVVHVNREPTANFVFSPYFYHSNKGYQFFSMYRYNVQDEYKHLVTYPSKLDFIRFGERVLYFDNKARLSNQTKFPIISISTCKHNNPVLIGISHSTHFTYYEQDPNTGLWTNRRINRLNEFEQVDVNKSIYYKYNVSEVNTSQLFFLKLSDETVDLVNKLCKGAACSNKISEEKPRLEVGIISFYPPFLLEDYKRDSDASHDDSKASRNEGHFNTTALRPGA